jgi:hypothetical protein
MQRRIARIGPFMPALAAVLGSVSLSLLTLQPPRGGLLPGPAPADRGHIGALVLPGAGVSRPFGHRSPVSAVAAPPVPRRQTPRPAAPAPAASPVRHPPSAQAAKSATVPAPQQAAEHSTPPVPAAPQLAALVRRGNGPAPNSNSRLLGHPRWNGQSPAGCHGRACAAGAIPAPEDGAQGRPPHAGHGKPKAAPAAAALQQADPPHEPPGHAGGPPGQGGGSRSAQH